MVVRFAFAVNTVLLSVVALTITVTRAATPLEFGMAMSVRSYDAICWYENLKIFPNTKSKDYSNCEGQAKFQQDAIENDEFFKENPNLREEYFGKWVNDQAMSGLPDKYSTSCSKYLDDSKAEPPANESEAVNDGGNNKYPYRGFAYCLMKTLRDTYGDGAIEAVKNERTVSKKHWMQTLLDRDNEFRVRHGAEPLQLMKDLNEAAQSWSDVNAKECNMYHSKGDDRKLKNDSTGESLAAGYGEEKEVAAYLASDGWYEEIQDYPFPDGYQGGDDALFEKIGHFTQSVWKGSKYVGYGLSMNAKCKDENTYTRYIAARYYPAGNMDGEYSKNVAPPPSSPK